VILLIGLEGTSYQEAATILDVPVGTIRTRVFRGRGDPQADGPET
jgi:DNA-directed RNA polymerase specialized sigma24 family protein